MFFKLTNNTQSMYFVWSHGHQVPVPPNETKALDIADGTALFLGRCQKRGSKFFIEAVDEAGEKVLTNIDNPLPRDPNYFNKNSPIRDEIAEELAMKQTTQEPQRQRIRR